MTIIWDYVGVYFYLFFPFSWQGLTHFDEILQEADGIILSRGNLGIDLPPEKVSSIKFTRVANLKQNSFINFKETINLFFAGVFIPESSSL